MDDKLTWRLSGRTVVRGWRKFRTTGAEMFVAPYPDRLVVEHTIWHADARVGEPHVQVFLSPIDFDALGDKAQALAMLRGAGWDASS
jgi:hypothetical protein